MLHAFHARIKKVLSEGVKTHTFFFYFNYFLVLMRGERIPIQLKAGHHRPAAKRGMAFRWRADDGLTLNAGLVALWFSGDLDQYC